MSSTLTPEQFEEYFKTKVIPDGLQLDSGARITDPKQFLSAQLFLYRNYGDTLQGKLCRDRLLRVKEILEAAEMKA
ncbi:MAG: hypothetical protein DI535_08060 [Citrobacter freundii]|nr:MAG: hypothetical protein DI535_08060 [Citrobacter freundii]